MTANQTPQSTDPMERIVEAALIDSGMGYKTDRGGGTSHRLDFELDNGVAIEVKRFHSPRVANQLARAENVILAQGEGAVNLLAGLIRSAGALDHCRRSETDNAGRAHDLHDRLKALYRRLIDFPEGSRCEQGVHLKPDAYVAFLDLRQLVEREVLPLLHHIRGSEAELSEQCQVPVSMIRG